MEPIDPQGLNPSRLRFWRLAFERWLKQRESAYGKDRARADRKAVEELLAFSSKPPWRIRTETVQDYVENLERSGLAPATIRKRLFTISKFFKYCQAEAVDPWLHRRGRRGFDPTQGVKRPEPTQPIDYYLNASEEQALLEAIRQDHSPMGLRNYALILCLLRTGMRVGTVRKLTYPRPYPEEKRETSSDNTNIFTVLPDEVLRAIGSWLFASGRMATIQAGDYIFSPSRDPLRIESKNNPKDWNPARPMAKTALKVMIKKYAQQAGLQAEKVNSHTLRNTAAKNMLRAGMPPLKIGEALGLRAKDKLPNYLKRLAEAKHTGFIKGWRPRQTGKGKPEQISHAPNRWKPGNQFGFKHGMFSRQLLPEVLAMKAAGELDGKAPHEILILNYKVAMERASALLKDETVAADTKTGIIRGMYETTVRILKLYEAARQLKRMQALEERGKEYTPDVYPAHKPSRSSQRSAYNPDNSYPKLSARERQRRYNEAHGILTHKPKRRSSKSKSSKAKSQPRRAFRRPEPLDDACTFHVDFFNEGEQEEA